MAKKNIVKEMKEAQEKYKSLMNKQKGISVDENKKLKKAKAKPRKTAREQYDEIRESLQPKAIEQFDEETLIKELFQGTTTVNEILNIEPEKEVPHREGLWDYVMEDEIPYFDPECTYELTGYKPITESKGLDFDPE